MSPATLVVLVRVTLPDIGYSMDSFEDLGLSPELVEALAAEGVERPTSIQKTAVPFIHRENNVILAAGPGSGATLAWATALLNRLSHRQQAGLKAIVLTSSRERANHLAESISPIANHMGHVVGALGHRWFHPEKALILFATPKDVLASCADHKLPMDDVEAIVFDQAAQIDEFDSLDEAELVLSYLTDTAQRIVISLPVTPAVANFNRRHVKRAIRLPSENTPITERHGQGTLRFRITTGPRDHEILRVVGRIIASGASQVLLYCRNDDRAADIGDYLSVHGYLAGAPGDQNVAAWLAVDPLEVKNRIGDHHEDVPVISCDVPTDADELDQRHGGKGDSFVIVLPREVPHLRITARQASYEVIPFPPEIKKSTGPIMALHDSIREIMKEDDIAPYLLALESLFEEYDAAEVAAALALLNKRSTKVDAKPAHTASASNTNLTKTPAWAKLFLGVGERDGLQPGDLLGAITGEAGVSGDTVGRIEIKENHTLVEVHDSVSHDVISALNGRTIRGRAVRADFDRPRRPEGRSRNKKSVRN